MLEKCRLAEHLEQSGLPSQGSNGGYKPLRLILGLFAGVWCGASCFGHLDVVRYDTALCNLLGWKRGADHGAYRCCFSRFSQAVNQRVSGNSSGWFFSELLSDNYTLDFDSTAMVRGGNQQGTAKGYNPKRPGRPSHRPLLAIVSEVGMAANHWLRPGNTAAGTNYLAFLEDTLSRLEDKKAGLVRTDSGSFTKEILDFPEHKKMHHVVACRLDNRIKNSLTHEKVWVEVADGLETSETSYRAESWDRPRRIIMAGQKI